MKKRIFLILLAGIILSCDDISLRNTIDEMVLGWTREVGIVSPEDNAELADKTPLLDWEDAGGATGYELQIVESEDYLSDAEIIKTTDSEYEISDGLILCDTRYWRVRAVNGTETGEWSDPRSFKIIISDTPALLGKLEIGGNPYKMEIQGDYAYIPYCDAVGVKIVDISTPSAPVLVKTINKQVEDLTVEDRYLYMLQVDDHNDNQLEIYDIADPSSPVLKSTCSLTSGSVNYTPEDCVLFGDSLYIAAQGESAGWGILRINVQNPASPGTPSFQVLTPEADPLWYMELSGGYGFITTNAGVYSCSFFGDVEQLDYYPISDQGEAFTAVSDHYLFVSDGLNASHPLIILDIADPSNMTYVSEYDPDLSTAWVYVYREYLFTTTYPDAKLRIIDISDINTPTLYTTKEDLPVSEVIGNYAYGVDYYKGKLVITDLLP